MASSVVHDSPDLLVEDQFSPTNVLTNVVVERVPQILARTPTPDLTPVLTLDLAPTPTPSISTEAEWGEGLPNAGFVLDPLGQTCLWNKTLNQFQVKLNHPVTLWISPETFLNMTDWDSSQGSREGDYVWVKIAHLDGEMRTKNLKISNKSGGPAFELIGSNSTMDLTNLMGRVVFQPGSNFTFNVKFNTLSTNPTNFHEYTYKRAKHWIFQLEGRVCGNDFNDRIKFQVVSQPRKCLMMPSGKKRARTVSSPIPDDVEEEPRVKFRRLNKTLVNLKLNRMDPDDIERRNKETEEEIEKEILFQRAKGFLPSEEDRQDGQQT